MQYLQGDMSDRAYWSPLFICSVDRDVHAYSIVFFFGFTPLRGLVT